MGLGAPSNLAARGRTLQEPADVRQRATSRTRLGSTHEWRLRRTHHASTDNAVCVQAIAASILRSTFAVPGIIGPGAWAREPGWRASYSFACQSGTAGSGADVDRLTACRLRGRVTIVEGRRACATVAVVDRGPENCGGDVCRGRPSRRRSCHSVRGVCLGGSAATGSRSETPFSGCHLGPTP